MADEIAAAVDELAGAKRRIVDAEAAMTRIVQAVLVRVFFGGRLSDRRRRPARPGGQHRVHLHGRPDAAAVRAGVGAAAR